MAPIFAGEADMVNGSRYISGNKKDPPFYRRVESRSVLDLVTNMDRGLSVADSQSGSRTFSGQAKGVLELRRSLYSSSMRVHIPGYFAMNP